MSALTYDALIEIMKEVQLAPSAHNTQPAFWRVVNGKFYLSFKDEKKLQIADPDDADLYLSLGAQIEGLSMALNARGVGIKRIEGEFNKIEITVEEQKGCDCFLQKFVSTRKTYRGSYRRAVDGEKKIFSDHFLKQKDVFLISDKNEIKKIASYYDRATLNFLRLPGYLTELYLWLRFSKKHKDWMCDGLNSESMSLSWIESWAASALLKESFFRAVDSIGLSKILFSEKGKVESSSFIFCLLKKKDDDDFIKLGRDFYRKWLECTSLGFNLCPLSNVVDDKEIKKEFESTLSLPKGYEVFKIFRAGPEPNIKKAPGRFRLDLDQYCEIKGEKR